MIPVSPSMISEEPKFTHGSIEKTGVLIVNLGTPEEPSSFSQKVFKGILSDPRVVEIPICVVANPKFYHSYI